MLGDIYPALLKTENGENIAQVLTAYIILLVAGQRLLPKSEFIATAALLVLEAKGRDLFQPFITKCMPDLEKLAALGETSDKKAPRRERKTK
jgi:hypothetical protein